MNKKKLAVIGASYLQLPLVLKAKEMGLEVYCFAWNDGAVCAEYANGFFDISIIEKEAILEKCQELKIDGIATIASDTATVAVNYVASKMGLVANPNDYTAVCTNKYLMRQCFMAHQVPSPKFSVADEKGIDLQDFQYPLIVKPTDRSGSRGVEKIETQEELASAIERAKKESFEHKAIVEEFVTGREISVESISYKGTHYILQITDKVTTGAPFFVELEHHQPSSLSIEIKEKVKNIVLHALDSLHIKFGASHSELKITADGDIKVIEIGARMGGDFIGSNLVKLSTGYDFLEGVVKVAMGNFVKPELTANNYSGVYFLSKETERLLPIIEHWKEYSVLVEAQITSRELKHIECSADRSGYMIYKSNHKVVF